MEIRKIRFTRHTNETGSLAFLESVRDIPFSIKRVYYIFDVAKGAIAVFMPIKNYSRF